MRQRTSQIDIDGVKYNEVFFPFADGYGYCDAIYKCDENGVYTCLWKKIDEKIVYPWISKVIKTARAWYPVVFYNSAAQSKSLAYKDEKVVSYADKEGFLITGPYVGGVQNYDLWFCGGFLILTNYGELVSYAVITKDGKQMHDTHEIVIDGSNSVGREIFKKNPYSSKYKGIGNYITDPYVLTDTEYMHLDRVSGSFVYEKEDEIVRKPFDSSLWSVPAIIWFEDGFLWIGETTSHFIEAHYTKNLKDEIVSSIPINSVGFGGYNLKCADYYYDKENGKVYFIVGEFYIADFANSVLRIISYDSDGNLIQEANIEQYKVDPLYAGICKEEDYFFFWATCNLYRTRDFTEIEAVDLGVAPSNATYRIVQTVVYEDDKYKCITSEYSETGKRYEGYIYTFKNNFKNFEKEIIGIKVPENSGSWA